MTVSGTGEFADVRWTNLLHLFLKVKDILLSIFLSTEENSYILQRTIQT
jgi:hypothetical protein